MNIAVQASDLDHTRIDGTRVYLRELLNYFGVENKEISWTLYHQREFNPALTPRHFSNYREKIIPFSFAWMQTRFALALFQDTPTKLFLPIQAAPFFLPRNLEVTATIHDMAWKKYPETFSFLDRLKLDIYLKHVVSRGDKLIAVSESTKRDLLKYFPKLNQEKVRVIHHGFDGKFFSEKISDQELAGELTTMQLKKGEYILYVGALQPRKNLVRLIQAFERLKTEVPAAKLVLAGEVAWLADDILQAQKMSAYKDDIYLLGRVSFEQIRVLYQGARFFAFPSLYEGFGLPILEAFASGTAVLTADNSSLREVAQDGALYCDGQDVTDMTAKMKILWTDESQRQMLQLNGSKQLDRFSWEKCAKETIDFLLK